MLCVEYTDGNIMQQKNAWEQPVHTYLIKYSLACVILIDIDLMDI